MKLFRVRETFSLDPGAFVESNRVDNQRFTFPTACGMAGVCRLEVFRMRAAIHIDHAKTGGPADVEDHDALQVTHLDDLETVRCSNLLRTGRRLASGMRRVTF